MLPRRLFRFERADLVLLLHFFRAFFESDLLSIRDQLTTVFSSVAGLLASFGLILPMLFNHKYRLLNALPNPKLYQEAATADKLMFICFAMGFSGVATLLKWQSLFPERKDFVILGPLPLERPQIFRAKLAALLLFVSLIIVSVNILPSFSLTAIMSGRWQEGDTSFLQILPHIASLFVSLSLAGYFTFFALLGAQAFLINVLPSRWFTTWSLAVQGTLLIVTCASLPLCLWIPEMHSLIRLDSPMINWLPPAWFLGFGEWIFGNGGSAMPLLAKRAAWSFCIAAVAALLLYGLTYARNTDQLMGSPVLKQRGRFMTQGVSWLLNGLTREPQEAAIVSFAIRSLLRSRLHKLLIAAVAGACLALVLDGFASLLIERALRHHAIAQRALLSAVASTPLVMAYFLLSGMVFIFSIPIELRANWIFRLSEVQEQYWGISAVEKILVLGIILPVSALTALLLTGWMGFSGALLQAAFVLLMCLILLEALLWNWNRIPFTCPYLPGKRNSVQSAVLFGAALSVFAYLATSIELRIASSVVALTTLLGTLLIIFAFLQVQRRKSWLNGLWIRFDENPDPDVQTLGLAGE